MTTTQKTGIVIIVLGFLMTGLALSMYSSRIVEIDHFDQPPWSTSKFSPVTYSLVRLDSERHLISFRNNSITPVYFLAYESEKIQTNFDKFAVRYALRPEVSYNGKVVVPASYGFDCGTGLVYVMIRPFETISDTVNLQNNLSRYTDPYAYFGQLNNSTFIDKMTGSVFPVEPNRQELSSQMASGLPVTVRFSMQLFDLTRNRNYISWSEEIELCRE